MMPEIDGFALAESIRRVNGTIPILFMSARDDLPAKQRGFRLLSYPNKTFSRAQLMDEFWGVESETSLRAVDVYITKLRDKFSACDGFEIRTVRGLGYKAVLK